MAVPVYIFTLLQEPKNPIIHGYIVNDFSTVNLSHKMCYTERNTLMLSVVQDAILSPKSYILNIMYSSELFAVLYLVPYILSKNRCSRAAVKSWLFSQHYFLI